jgi:hypothetical protein
VTVGVARVPVQLPKAQLELGGLGAPVAPAQDGPVVPAVVGVPVAAAVVGTCPPAVGGSRVGASAAVRGVVVPSSSTYGLIRGGSKSSAAAARAVRASRRAPAARCAQVQAGVSSGSRGVPHSGHGCTVGSAM